MNLWADLDNNLQHSPDSAVHGRARRLTERMVLSLLREWLLQDYAASYCRSLAATRIFRRCYWVDALGIDARANSIPIASVEDESPRPSRGGKRRKKDSPPMVFPPAVQPIAMLAQALAQERQPITLNGLVLEAGSSKRKEIRASQSGSTPPTRTAAIPEESGIVPGSWLERAVPLLQAIEQAPAIFLLNPFGHTLFSYEDLAPLYSRTVPTELCLLVSHKQIALRLQAAQQSLTQAAALTALLRTDRWKSLPTEEAEIAQAIDRFLELLTVSMKRYFLLPIQRIVLPMQVRPAFVENLPYTLIFATRRQDSLISMNDAVCAYRRRIYEQSHRGILAEEWFVSQQQERYESALREVYHNILQAGKAQRLRRWPDLRQQLLLANFGQFPAHDYDMLLQQLLVDRAVVCEWRRPSGEDEVQRLPGNEDTLMWR